MLYFTDLPAIKFSVAAEKLTHRLVPLPALSDAPGHAPNPPSCRPRPCQGFRQRQGGDAEGVVRSRAAPSPSDPGPQLPRPVWGRSAGFGLCPALQGGEARVRGPTGRCRVLFRYCTCSPVLFATLHLPILYAISHGGSGIRVPVSELYWILVPVGAPGGVCGVASPAGVGQGVRRFRNTRDMLRIIWGGIGGQKERGCRCNSEKGLALPDD